MLRYHEFRAMSTDILLAAEGSAEELAPAFQEIQAYIEACEWRFSRFKEESELSALNRSAGDWFKASAEMYELVSLALRFYVKTHGLFDPSILTALEEAGYDRTIDDVKARNGMDVGSIEPDNLRVAMKAHTQTFSQVQMDPALRRIWLPPGLRIDLGGIAKGWIAEQATRKLSVWTRACAVDAGGDGYYYGLPAGETCWRVTLEDPMDAGHGLAVLKIGPGALATSTITKRSWQKHNHTQHHIIDPKTQKAADTEWLSVTVVAPHTADAEVYAKSLLIGGSKEAERLFGIEPRIEFIAVDRKMQLWGSKHSRELLDV